MINLQQTEANQEPNFDPSLNPKEARKALFGHLEFSLGVCRAKAQKKKALNADRQRWIRLLIFAVEAYSKLLDSVQLEDIEARLEKIEHNETKEVGQIE